MLLRPGKGAPPVQTPESSFKQFAFAAAHRLILIARQSLSKEVLFECDRSSE
jgi:hypothetical protein